MSGTLPWYVARASGLVAWSLLAASVVWGLLMSSKVMRQRVKNSWLLDLHRWLGGLALVFTGIHVAAIMGDTYVHFGLASVLVPLAAHWHPVAVAWGIASLYLLAAVEVTSLVRRHLDHRLWRRVHFLSFPLFVASTAHGVSAGTDGRKPMVIVAAALVTVAVAALTVARIRYRADQPSGDGPHAVRTRPSRPQPIPPPSSVPRREPASKARDGDRASAEPPVHVG